MLMGVQLKLKGSLEQVFRDDLLSRSQSETGNARP